MHYALFSAQISHLHLQKQTSSIFLARIGSPKLHDKNRPAGKFLPIITVILSYPELIY